MASSPSRNVSLTGFLLSWGLVFLIVSCEQAKDPVEGAWKLPGKDIAIEFTSEGVVSMTVSSLTTTGTYRRDASGRLLVDLGSGEREATLSAPEEELRLSTDPSDTDIFLRKPVAALVDSAEALFRRGYKARDCDSSITWYSQAIELLEGIPSEKTHLARAYNNRGICREKSGLPDEAITDYSSAVRLDPKLELAYGNRAWLYDKLGKKEEALADYRKAAELGYLPAIRWLERRGRAVHAKGRISSPSAGSRSTPISPAPGAPAR